MSTFEFMDGQLENLRRATEDVARQIDSDPYYLGQDGSDTPDYEVPDEIADADFEDLDSEAYEHLA